MGKLFKKPLCFYATLFAVFAVVAPPAGAVECLSPSPSITRMGETPYDPIDVRKLTDSEYQDVSKLFQSLDGDWQGRGTRFFCRSDSDPSDIETEQATIRADVQVDRYANLKLSAELYVESDRTSYQKNLWLYLNNRYLRIDSDNSTGDVQLLTVSDDKVAFFTRQVLQTGTTGGSARQERFYTISNKPDGFAIELRLYVQGKLSSGYTWYFKR